jgi:hypothetical protein
MKLYAIRNADGLYLTADDGLTSRATYARKFSLPADAEAKIRADLDDSAWLVVRVVPTDDGFVAVETEARS